MAATRETILGQFSTPQNGPATVAGAFPQVGGTSQDLDLLQIVEEGQPGTTPSVVLNVGYDGTVNYPASSPTNGTRLGVFYTRLTYVTTSNPTLAQLFADVFDNPDQSDIFQVINPGGNAHYYLNYAGVATGS
jgi:hypothetical protein